MPSRKVLCQLHCCCGAGAGYHPLIHPLPAATTWTLAHPCPPPFTDSLLSPRGHFLCPNQVFELPPSEPEDGLCLWNSGSERCSQDGKNGGPFFQKYPETPDCPSLSPSVVFPIPWPPVHVSSFLHVHTITQSPQNPVLSCVPHVTLDGKVLLTGRPNTKGDASGVQKAVPLIHSSRTVDYSNEKPLPLSLAHGHKNDKCQWKPWLF